jgi:hypothetical protein
MQRVESPRDDVASAFGVRHLAFKFRTTQKAVRDAVRKVGPSRDAVEQELRRTAPTIRLVSGTAPR